jgi:hypothetical protein
MSIQIILILFFKFEEKVNCRLKEDERQPFKKRPNISSNSIFNFYIAKKPFKKDDVMDTITQHLHHHLH